MSVNRGLPAFAEIIQGHGSAVVVFFVTQSSIF